MVQYLDRLKRMDQSRLTRKMYDVGREENLPWWMEVKEVLSKYGIDENTHVTEGRREMKVKCEQ